MVGERHPVDGEGVDPARNLEREGPIAPKNLDVGVLHAELYGCIAGKHELGPEGRHLGLEAAATRVRGRMLPRCSKGTHLPSQVVDHGLQLRAVCALVTDHGLQLRAVCALAFDDGHQRCVVLPSASGTTPPEEHAQHPKGA